MGALLFSARELFGLVVIALSLGALPLLPIGVLVLLGVRYLGWWRFTYKLEHDPDGAGAPVLWAESGVLHRKVRRVPLDRVQRVELLRPVRHRLLGLAVLRVDTAGGGSAGEVELDATSAADARAIHDLLDRWRRATAAVPGESETDPAAGSVEPTPAEGLHARLGEGTCGGEVPRPGAADDGAGTGAGGAAQREGVERSPVHAGAGSAEPATPFVQLTTGRLALAGITGSQLLVMLAVAGWLLQLLDDLPGPSAQQVITDAEAPRTVLSIGLGVGGLLVLWLGLAALATILTHHGLAIVLDGDDLRVRRGLLDVRETVVPLRRVQAVRLEQNLLRRALGLVSLRIVTAGDPGQESGHVLLPALSPDEVDSVLQVVMPEACPLPPLAPAPRAARLRTVLRRALPAAVLGALVVAWLRTPLAGAAAVLVVALATVVGFDAFRGLGLGRPGRIIVTRTGSLVRTTWLVPAARTQSVGVRTTPFQRRQQLADLHLDVAGLRRAARVVERPASSCRSMAVDALATSVPT